MTKMTTEQAIEAVRNAMTHEAIQAILMTCTKAMMREVFSGITHEAEVRGNSSKTKEVLARFYAAKIILFREEEEFRNQPFSMKFETLRTSPNVYKRLKLLGLLSQAELELTALRLGIEETQDNLAGRIYTELNVSLQIKEVKAARQAHDQAVLREALTSGIGIAGTIALDRLIAEAGLNVKHPESDIEKWEALYEYYTSWIDDREVELSKAEEEASQNIAMYGDTEIEQTTELSLDVSRRYARDDARNIISKAIAEHDLALLSRCRTKCELIREEKKFEPRTFAERMYQIGNRPEQLSERARKPEMLADRNMSEKCKTYPEGCILRERRENLRQALHGMCLLRQTHRHSYRCNAENEHQRACLQKA